MAAGDETDPWGLELALAGDQDAWTAIVDEFWETTWHWARTCGLSDEDAEDVVQDTWYLLWDRGKQIQDRRALPGWLATTTRRLAYRKKKRSDRQQHDLAFDDTRSEPIANTAGPDELATGADLASRLQAAFERLSQQCRELLALFWRSELSYQDVAEALGMPIGSVGPTRQRCLGKLRLEAGVSNG